MDVANPKGQRPSNSRDQPRALAVKVRKIGLFIGALALVAAIIVGPAYMPGRASRVNLDRLKDGMTMRSARVLMGAPDVIGHDYSHDGDSVIYKWARGNEHFVAVFHDGKLVDKGYTRYREPG